MQFNILIKDWLEKRKITETVQDEFNVRDGSHPILGDCIVIPVHDESGMWAFNKYRRSPLLETGIKYLYDKGGQAELFGWFKAKNKQEVLITEGELDALVAWSFNIPAVSSTGGANTFLSEWALRFESKDVILCYDNDQAGGEGMARVLGYIPHARVLFLPDSPGMKDISDYAARGGDLAELIKTAKRFQGLEDVMADRAERLATFHSTYFHDAYIKQYERDHVRPVLSKGPRIEGDAVTRAKQFPITDMLKFNAAGNTNCPFHNEKTASLHYYRDDNHCYCFGGCGRAYDSIDIYRKINGSTFKEAVKALQ